MAIRKPFGGVAIFHEKWRTPKVAQVIWAAGLQPVPRKKEPKKQTKMSQLEVVEGREGWVHPVLHSHFQRVLAEPVYLIDSRYRWLYLLRNSVSLGWKPLSFFFWHYHTSEHRYGYNWSAGCADNGLSHCHKQENEPCLWLIFTSRGPLMWSLPNSERCPPQWQQCVCSPPPPTAIPQFPPPPRAAPCVAPAGCADTVHNLKLSYARHNLHSAALWTAQRQKMVCYRSEESL